MRDIEEDLASSVGAELRSTKKKMEKAFQFMQE